ncbi:hypothetical protein Q8A67_000777 [Cirrhinus molitorella]|uniref:Uncharacterized protein n=1 Tax=Cirrhinus molitorella TaxID=172907 RepID=A0AA88TY15_9TELE|nr:hypothetical protein Q8A67_000777 [Cirrhinus molitorella]
MVAKIPGVSSEPLPSLVPVAWRHFLFQSLLHRISCVSGISKPHPVSSAVRVEEFRFGGCNFWSGCKKCIKTILRRPLGANSCTTLRREWA